MTPEECVEGSILGYALNGLPGIAYAKGYTYAGRSIIIQPYKPRCRPEIPGQLPSANIIPCIGRTAPTVPFSSITWCITPWRAARLVKPHTLLTDLLESAGADMIGLTGSRALACERPDSDYDLIVYSRDPDQLVRNLRSAQKRGIIRQCQTGRVLVKRRDRNDYSRSPEHIVESLVESCAYDIPYTLRILRSPRAVPCEALEARIHSLGVRRVKALLEPTDPESVLVPSRYKLRLLSPGGEPLVMESWRTRYADLKRGEYIIVGELFYDENLGVLVISPDMRGGVWRLG